MLEDYPESRYTTIFVVTGDQRGAVQFIGKSIRKHRIVLDRFVQEGADLKWHYVEAMNMTYIEMRGAIWIFQAGELATVFREKSIDFTIISNMDQPFIRDNAVAIEGEGDSLARCGDLFSLDEELERMEPPIEANMGEQEMSDLMESLEGISDDY